MQRGLHTQHPEMTEAVPESRPKSETPLGPSAAFHTSMSHSSIPTGEGAPLFPTSHIGRKKVTLIPVLAPSDATDRVPPPLTQFENESSMNSNEACRMYALQAGLMETLGESMAPALLGRNISNVTTFSYPAFKTSHLILNQVLTR